MTENGALSPDVYGDQGCSVGIPQRYVCQFGYSAKSFVKKYPEWKDIDFQLEWMADAMKKNLDTYGTARCAIVSHNRPADASPCTSKTDTAAGYFRKVEKNAKLLTL